MKKPKASILFLLCLIAEMFPTGERIPFNRDKKTDYDRDI